MLPSDYTSLANELGFRILTRKEAKILEEKDFNPQFCSFQRISEIVKKYNVYQKNYVVHIYADNNLHNVGSWLIGYNFYLENQVFFAIKQFKLKLSPKNIKKIKNQIIYGKITNTFIRLTNDSKTFS